MSATMRIVEIELIELAGRLFCIEHWRVGKVQRCRITALN